MKTLTLRLPEAVDARLAALARSRGTSKSEVVRDALERYTEGERAGSVYDLASDLCGLGEGPGDLSSNPDHLEDFGR